MLNYKKIQALAAKAVKIFGKKPKNLSTTYDSQPHVLAYRMEDVRMTHDTKALVDLHRIRIEKSGSKEKIVYFCPLQPISVKEVIKKGDGTAIPSKVELKNLKGPRFSGKLKYFDVSNVILHSNGTITLEATPETKWKESQLQ